MRVVLQRVSQARLSVAGEEAASIGPGLVAYVGFSSQDSIESMTYILNKIWNLRVFEDENGKTNLSLADVNGELLLVSQFTLYANCRKGNRPSFIEAGAPDEANKLYEYIISEAGKQVPVVEHGIFGADMKVSLENDGPFTVIFDENLRG